MEEKKKKKNSDARLRANAKYDSLHTKSYTVKMNKELYEIMSIAFKENKECNNQNAYTIQAIKDKLQRDGYLK